MPFKRDSMCLQGKISAVFGKIHSVKLRILYLLPVVLAVASTSFGGEVKCVRAPMPLKTYPVGAPEKNPMFFEKRGIVKTFLQLQLTTPTKSCQSC